MPYIQVGEISYFTLDIFASQNLQHGFFMRHGGVSPAPWNSLNTATSVGDTRENIIENRKRIFKAINRPVESIFDVWQVHSNRVICTNGARTLDVPPQKADAIVTNRSEITLFMRFADCVPIMLYDPFQGVVAMAHAGWKGTVNKIVNNTLEAMQDHYHTKAVDVLAGIGPSIGPDHYEVGRDVIEQVEKAFGVYSSELFVNHDGHTHFNLWKANEFILRNAGVEKIQISEICTGCNTADWFSHRAEHGKAGRFGAILAISN
jgi:polyphenol oxidase